MQQRCNKGATEVQQRCNSWCNRGATEMQQKCNIDATEMQQRCNRDATEVQQRCNRGATEVQQRCNNGATTVILAKVPCALNCGGGEGGWWGGGGWGRCRQNMLRLLGWRRWGGRGACGSRRRGWRPVATGSETGRGRPQVPRPSRRRRRCNSAHELLPRPRPAAALPLPSAVGRHGPGGAHWRRSSPAQRPGPQLLRPATRPRALLLGWAAAAGAAGMGVG